ncbi:MAG: hypothetical protein K1X35_10795 [Caulobacteraceae bacterium]|nr:hypothetical protein [Caulobacteraceae bacterium]
MKRMALTLALMSGLVLGSVAITTAVNAAPSRSRDLRGPQEVRGADGELVRDGKAITPEESKALAMAEAPAVLQRANTVCTITDALATGNGKVTINGAQVEVKTYEVACSEGLGYLLQDRGAGGAFAFDCIQVAASNAATAAAAPAAATPARGQAAPAAAPQSCRLSANQNAVAMIQPVMTATGKTCAVSNVAFLGQSATSGLRRYEVACGASIGYIIDRPATGAPTAVDCISASASGAECKLTSKEQINAYIGSIATRSGRPCNISGTRVMGSTSSGSTYYELACAGAQGYVMETKGGAFVRAIDCLEAAGIGGGCTLTNVAAVAEAREGEYLQALRAKGIACAGTEFRVLGHDSRNRDVVEFKCTDRPAGLVAFVPKPGSGTTDITNFDCFEAEGRSLQCQLTSHADLAQRLKVSMAAKNCDVSNYAVRGASETDGLVVEVSCRGSEAKGYIIDLPEDRGPFTTANSCAQAASRGSEPCRLPENR